MDRTNQQVVLLFALLIFYAIGPVILLIWGVWAVSVASSNVIELDTPLAKFLSTFATNPGAYTGIIHQMIMPVAAAITAANFGNIAQHRLARWLFMVPLAGVLVCIIDALYFNSLLEVPDTSTALAGTITASGAIGEIFLSTGGQLATYTMLLVGLQLANPMPAAPLEVSSDLGDDDRGSVAWQNRMSAEAGEAVPAQGPSNAPGVG